MLITSRETKRWVLPKGNPINGLSDHQAAAHEAYEEAGLAGVACPTALGSYQYRKKRKSGASLMFGVTVFPFAVTEQADAWPECEERETRWFTLAEASATVDEPDLASLLLSFREGQKRADSAIASLLGRGQQKWGGAFMFGWFQALLPKQGNFFEMFEAHAKTVNAAAEALARLLQGGPGMGDHIREIVEREHEADDITREVLQTVRRTFITPFDRSAISSLIGVMDDAIDQMNQTAATIKIYDVTEFDPQMKDMTGIIVEAARVCNEAVGLLRNVGANASRLHLLTERLVKLEGEADGMHDNGIKALFEATGDAQPMRFIVGREIYSHLERVVDRFEDVANEIQGLVIDHA
jgi:predicted phosphate transport protein (TIGR00153 family)